jgi:hypothetical protein
MSVKWSGQQDSNLRPSAPKADDRACASVARDGKSTQKALQITGSLPRSSSVKSYQLPDLESETPANWQLDLPGMVVAAGDSLQI